MGPDHQPVIGKALAETGPTTAGQRTWHALQEAAGTNDAL